MNESQTVLIIGGSGMLLPAVRTLLERGATVMVVARRPDRAAPPASTAGEFIPVQGQWSEPGVLVDRVLASARHRNISLPLIHGAIVWVHSPHRRAVLDELDRLLAPDATVLQLWGSATRDPRDVMDAEAHSEYPWRLRHLFLGYHRGPFATRWLTDEEISHATVHAWDTDDDSFHAGQLDPWEQQQ